MNKYVINIKDMPGEEVVLKYNQAGKLMQIDASNGLLLSAKQLQFLKVNIPVLLIDEATQLIELIKKTNDKITITKGELDVSFETFWELYNYKRHKLPAQKLFEKMSYAEKVKCIDSIKPYDTYRTRKGWLEKMLADTYLRNKEWEADWKKLK
jgi:hypothetical protein